MNEEPKILVGRFYTAARKFNQLIGRLPDGTVIRGGPYTITQLVPAVTIIFLAALKFWIFGFPGVLWAFIQIVVVLLVAGASIFILGKVPPTRRSLFHLASTYPALIFSSKTGYWNGQAIKSDHDLRIHPTIQFIPAALILIIFAIKLAVAGPSSFASFLMQLLLVAALIAASLFLLRQRNDSSETPSEETSNWQASEQEIHDVTTKKATQRAASGFSRFQTEIK